MKIYGNFVHLVNGKVNKRKSLNWSYVLDPVSKNHLGKQSSAAVDLLLGCNLAEEDITEFLAERIYMLRHEISDPEKLESTCSYSMLEDPYYKVRYMQEFSRTFTPSVNIATLLCKLSSCKQAVKFIFQKLIQEQFLFNNSKGRYHQENYWFYVRILKPLVENFQ